MLVYHCLASPVAQTQFLTLVIASVVHQPHAILTTYRYAIWLIMYILIYALTFTVGVHTSIDIVVY